MNLVGSAALYAEWVIKGGKVNDFYSSVSKTYKEQQVLCDVSVEMHGGVIYGLVGPNGCGKTR